MKNNSIIYRPIEVKDNIDIKDIILRSLTEYGANREGFAAKDPELDDLYSFYSKAKGSYFIAEQNETVIGGSGIAPLEGDPSTWELQKMYLDKSARGLGVGTSLMQMCISSAKKNKVRFLYIETLDSMLEANKMYLKFGFKELDKPKGNTGHFGCDKYYLLDLS